MKEFSLMAILLVWVMKASPAFIATKMRVPITLEKDKSVFRKFLDAAFAGALSCSLTHSMVVPLDVVKVRYETQFRVQITSVHLRQCDETQYYSYT